MSARPGGRFYALFSLFVLFLVGLIQNSANGHPSKMDTARRLAKNLPFLSHHQRSSKTPFSRLPSRSKVNNRQTFSYSSVDDTRPYDVVFIVDDSGSIPRDQFNKGLSALRLLIGRAVPGTKFAAIKFSNRATLLFNFVSSDQAKSKLVNVAYDAGATNTQDALKMARRDLFLNPSASGHRKFAGRLAVVVTDGNSNVQRVQTVPQATLLKGIGTEVMVIAVGNFGDSGRQEIRNIASYPHTENVYQLDDFDQMLEVTRMALSLIPS